VAARVSVDGAGAQGQWVQLPAVDRADGRYVASRRNLVAGDTNLQNDIFVRDRDADGNGVFDEPGGGATRRVSVFTTGAQAAYGNGVPVISGDGRTVVFWSLGTLVRDGTRHYSYTAGGYLYVHDLATGETLRGSVGDDGAAAANNGAARPAISGDGASAFVGGSMLSLATRTARATTVTTAPWRCRSLPGVCLRRRST
jgi:hypothetical protein